ncbi:hypothetical protein Vadar_021821 [Vaccinium darrowii]|uniref:Uncharacterized protein n=1 Tax=Vaccinium darrowii TaxID=229202 RepID=A0ACB7XJ31_9ERIC|nr:hypothetical protein Vadar_021821 [Vaccinium darrowii]
MKPCCCNLTWCQLKAFAEARQLDIGKAVHCHILHSVLNRSRIVCNSLLNMYYTCLSSTVDETGYGDDLVCKVFDTMRKRGVIAWNTMISCINSSCLSAGIVSLGKQLHCFVIHNCLDNNFFVASALIDMYSKSGAISYAENVFSMSPERNSVTYTKMILGYGQHGFGEKALSLFYSMRESDIRLDTSALLSDPCAAVNCIKWSPTSFLKMGCGISRDHCCIPFITLPPESSPPLSI